MSRCIQLKYASVRGHTDLKPATFECLQRKKQVLISNNAGLFKSFGASIFFSTLRKPLLWTVPSHSKTCFCLLNCVLCFNKLYANHQEFPSITTLHRKWLQFQTPTLQCWHYWELSQWKDLDKLRQRFLINISKFC